MVACEYATKIHLQGEILNMVRFTKLNKDEKSSRYFNMKARCGKEYQDRNPRYYETFMCDIWEDNKELYYEWLDENFYEGGKWITSTGIDTYNRALDIYCDIKQGILVTKAKALKDYVPEKVYMALMNTDIRAINSKHYLANESEV